MTSKLPRWATENYKGDETDFTVWLEEALRESDKYKPRLDQFENDKEATARVEAELKFEVMSCTQAIRGKAYRAVVHQLVQANKTGWYRYLDAELSSTAELLAALVDATEEGTSEAYDLAFLADTAVPLLVAAGIKEEDIVGVGIMTSKARAIVPALRDLMKCPECGSRDRHHGTNCKRGHELELDDDAKDTAVALTRMVGDPNTTARDIREKVAEMRGRATKTLKPLEKGEIYLLGDGTELVVIKSPSTTYTRAIEMALGQIIRNGLQHSDLVVLANTISANVLGVSFALEEPVSPSPW